MSDATEDEVTVEIDGKRYYRRGAKVGNVTDDGAMLALQNLANAGHIKLTHYWCSEIGYVDVVADGEHFHSEGSVHLPHKFEMVKDPGEGWQTLFIEPYTLHFPLKKDDPDAH